MDIQALALILLIGRLISEAFIIAVIRKQWRIRKSPIHPKLKNLRRVLTLLAVLVFIGNIYPLGLDLFTLFNDGVRTSSTINLVGTIYSLDNNLTFMFASILIWTLYKLSDVVIEVAELVTGKRIDAGTEKK